ncbi:MAG: hypothetical protein KatS3mg101_0684 [Patescibacteria group bacterium]|nr:MAG: hypothetical protein KatS3mg101_0684 [Patescibacteria group bacterium]
MFRKETALKTQTKKAWEYIKKLFGLKITQIVLISLLILTVAPLVFFYILKPEPRNDIRYGVTFSNKYASQLDLNWKDAYIKILDDLGAKNLRLVAYWDEIEITPDNYDYSDIKWQLEEAEKRNANVILAIGRKVPRYPECFEPSWWRGLSSESARDKELYEYIIRTVMETQSFNSIKMWQVENEPFFPFGECLPIKKPVVEQEIQLVRALDERPILTQDSGEGGFWFPTYQMADYLGISMYRKVWYDFWGVLTKHAFVFKYPLSHWSYKIRAHMTGVPMDRIVVTELQAEPWGPAINSKLTTEDKNRTMSLTDFLSTIAYAQKSGFRDQYFWGVEWWLWEKEFNNNPTYWNVAKALFEKK